MYNSIKYICVPQKHGQDKDGVELGPETLLEFGIEQLFQKHSQTPVESIHLPKPAEVPRTRGDFNLKNIPEVKNMNIALRDAIAKMFNENGLLFNLGGDHSMGTGSIAGLKKALPGKKIGIIWFDAHPDINTPESSPSGNIHGIPLALACGIGPDCLKEVMTEYITTQDIMYVAIRSIDDGEAEIIAKDGITHFTAADVKKVGIQKVVETAMEKFKDYDFVHLSFDIDGIDPEYIIGTGTRVPEGLNLEDTQYFLKNIRNLKNLHSIDIVEYNPSLERDNTGKCIMKCFEAFFEQ